MCIGKAFFAPEKKPERQRHRCVLRTGAVSEAWITLKSHGK